MKLRKLYITLAMLGIPFIFFNRAVGCGWIIGQSVMVILTIVRVEFYDKILNTSKFNVRRYILYILFTITLIAGPLLISFFFRNLIEPLAIFAAYFVDRFLTFIVEIFIKESSKNAK